MIRLPREVWRQLAVLAAAAEVIDLAARREPRRRPLLVVVSLVLALKLLADPTNPLRLWVGF